MTTVWGDNQIKVELNWRWNGVSAVNVLWFWKPSGNITDIEMENLLDNGVRLFWSTYRARAATQCILETMTATQWDAPEGQTVTVTDGRAGVLSTGTVSSNVAVVASFRTGRAGRSRRGRIYVPGAGEEEVIGNAPTDNLRNAIIVGLLQMGTYALSQGIAHIVSSAFADGAPRATRLASIISQILVDARVDTQRRRLPNAFTN